MVSFFVSQFDGSASKKKEEYGNFKTGFQLKLLEDNLYVLKRFAISI